MREELLLRRAGGGEVIRIDAAAAAIKVPTSSGSRFCG
jgi:hypothetical protein